MGKKAIGIYRPDTPLINKIGVLAIHTVAKGYMKVILQI